MPLDVFVRSTTSFVEAVERAVEGCRNKIKNKSTETPQKPNNPSKHDEPGYMQ